MAIFERDDVRIHYEVRGEGFPILLIAPGGMRSRIDAWERAPWNPWEELPSRWRVVAMDQRNAGASTAPVAGTDGWATYTSDQLALLDHLGIDRFAVVGMCIGGPYAVRLIRAAPERVAAAVLLQPIGRQDNRHAFLDIFDGWAAEIDERHPEADTPTWESFRENMFGSDALMFGATREDVRACATPLLVALGNDLYHPESTSRAVVNLAPDATLVERWKEGDDVLAAAEAITSFLAKKTGGS